MKKIFFLIYCCFLLASFVLTAQTVTYPSLPVTASEAYLSVYAKGRISIKYINPANPVLTRPLIVAEGFDPGHITAPEKISGESAIADFVADVRDNNNLQTLLFDFPQYDVVYVDWSNGTDFLQRNALLLEEVIRWVNNNKVAVGGVVQPNVVLGQSMGGVIARWALRDMEDKGQNHQTRLYISYDAPQQGANVPQGYQHLARHARDLYIKAAPLAGPVETIQFFRGRQSPFHALSLSNEPAARQMLVNYVNDINIIDNSMHNAWQTELKNKGYPQGVAGIPFRRVAVSNGSECAASQPFAAGSVLLSYNGKGKASFWGDLAADVIMPAVSLTLNQPAMGLGLTLPGNTSMGFEMEVKSKADGSSNQVYKGKVTYTKKVLGLINVTAVLTNRSFSSSSSTLPYDNFPGGFYDVSKEFDLSSSPISNDLIKFNATVQQQPHFCFIPTPSALDIGGGNVTLAKADYLTSYVGANPPATPKNTPFQNFITAFNDGSANNEEHISILRRNGDWVADELTNTPQAANCSAFCTTLTMTGPATLCTSATYSVQAITGATYTWTAIPAGSITFSGTGNAVTATKNATFNGNATIRVTVAIANCGNTVLNKAVAVGNVAGSITATYNSPSNPAQPLYPLAKFDLTTYYDACLSLRIIPTNVPSGVTVTWSATVSPGATWQQVGNYFVCFFTALNQTADVNMSIANACGSSSAHYRFRCINTGLCGGPTPLRGIISPNPAQHTVTVTLNEEDNMAAKAGIPAQSGSNITQVKIYNAYGATVKSVGYAGTAKQVQVDVSGLAAGLYFLEVSNGTNSQTTKLVIAR